MRSSVFRFEGFVDRRHVVELMEFVQTLKTYDFSVVPVNNAKDNGNGELTAETIGGKLTDKIEHKLRELPPHTVVSRKTMFGWARSMSYSPNSTFVAQLVKAKVLKKGKKRGEFLVVPAK